MLLGGFNSGGFWTEGPAAHHWRVGGFTTFSTFAHESMQLLQNGNIAAFAGYVAASLIAGLSFVAVGYWLVK